MAKADSSPTSRSVTWSATTEEGTVASTPRLLRFPDVRARTGLSRSTIWRLERRGDFPRHHRISPNAVAWVEEELTTWILGRVRNEQWD